MTAPARRPGLAARLMLAQTVIITVALLLAWLLAGLYGPHVFREHLHTDDQPLPPAVLDRAERAFHATNVIDLAVAVAIAATLALALSATLAHHVVRSLSGFVGAATQIAAGHYRVRVATPTVTPELDAAAEAFNAMAGRLGAVEGTRRRLLTDLAHELRTPIATLDGYLEAMQDGVRQADPATLELLRSQTARLARLTEDVAAISAAEEGRLRLQLGDVDVAELVAASASAGQALADQQHPGKTVTISVDVEPGLPSVQGDRARLEQAVANLLTNAIRHSKVHGTITIGAHRGAGNTVEITVHDDGEGIAAEHLPHLFERFYRGDPARPSSGTGVGLTIARAIVAAHAGSITADSPGPGEGATFRIRLPAAGR